MQKNQDFGGKWPQEAILGHIEKKKKNRKKNQKKNFFLVKNPKFLMGLNFFLSPIGAHLGLQNGVLWFFSPEKRKFRRKIALGGFFE